MTRRGGSLVGLAMVLALAAAPAGAIESVSGTYEAKVSCKGIAGGVKGKQKMEVDLQVVDNGDGTLLLDWEGLQNGLGYVLTETAKPENGVVSGIACTLSPAGLDGWAFRADAKIKAGSDEGSMKGTLLILDDVEQESATCKVTAKRVSAVAPKLSGCVLL